MGGVISGVELDWQLLDAELLHPKNLNPAAPRTPTQAAGFQVTACERSVRAAVQREARPGFRV